MARPSKYTELKEVEDIIDTYFNSVTHTSESGELISKPTISGLAYALGLSRQGLLEYGRKDEFSDTIKRAKDFVQVALEANLYNNSVTGTIFNLKNNFGWKDKTERDTTINGEVNLTHIVSEYE